VLLRAHNVRWMSPELAGHGYYQGISRRPRGVEHHRRNLATYSSRCEPPIESAQQASKVLRAKCGFRRQLIDLSTPRPSMQWPAGHSTAPSIQSASGLPTLAVRVRADELGVISHVLSHFSIILFGKHALFRQYTRA
jgi:hypothetical protein